MTGSYSHKLLVVDDDESIPKIVERLFSPQGIRVIYAASGESGLEKFTQVRQPFSIILSDQRLPGMAGHEFLKQASQISPDSIRILITAYQSVDDIINAINIGHVHKIIRKPWENQFFLDTVNQSLTQYEVNIEEKKLFETAREHNEKLYNLKKELLNKMDAHKEKLSTYTDMICRLEQELERIEVDPESQRQKGIKTILTQMGTTKQTTQENLDTLYVQLLSELIDQFKGISSRRGFEMDFHKVWGE
ncbi:MAG: response regulator [Desulfobacteraceae bacterium]|nr:MAG: response regulator [Desulfobacteraceae bacterium]